MKHGLIKTSIVGLTRAGTGINLQYLFLNITCNIAIEHKKNTRH